MNRDSAKAELLRLCRFGAVGVAATLVHMGISLGVHTLLTTGVQTANLIGFLVAFIVSFLGQYHWTFQSDQPYRKAMLKFFLVAFGGYLASASMLGILSVYMAWLDAELRLLLSILIIPAITYLLGRFMVF